MSAASARDGSGRGRGISRSIESPAARAPQASAVRAALLDWYDREARDLPWRVSPLARRQGVQPDPYAVWLSEVMLQQTTTVHAAPYFRTFMARWPTVSALAAAADGELMAAWAGLGYYARARNLLACARAVVERHGGVFPGTEAQLLALPGVGPYTAAAVAAIAFDEATNVVDGNVERVVSRLFAVQTPLPAAKPRLRALAADLIGDERPGDWAQALMDLGAGVCTPRSPQCGRCPLDFACLAFEAGRAAAFPFRAPKSARPLRRGLVLTLVSSGEVGLVRRPPRGLLGGMMGLPTSPWSAGDPDLAWLDASPGAKRPCGLIRHVFTHFELELRVFRADLDARPAIDAQWTPRHEAQKILPSVFRKALDAAMGGPDLSSGGAGASGNRSEGL